MNQDQKLTADQAAQVLDPMLNQVGVVSGRITRNDHIAAHNAFNRLLELARKGEQASQPQSAEQDTS